MNIQEAVDAAAEVLASLDHTDDWTGWGDFYSLDGWERDCARDAARTVLTAALPHLREQIAQEIEEDCKGALESLPNVSDHGRRMYRLGSIHAARIVRGEP